MKKLGYIIAPFYIEDSPLDGLKIYSKDEIKKLKSGEMTDIYIHHLIRRDRHLITYAVFEDKNGKRIYKPTNLYERGKRFILQKIW